MVSFNGSNLCYSFFFNGGPMFIEILKCFGIVLLFFGALFLFGLGCYHIEVLYPGFIDTLLLLSTGGGVLILATGLTYSIRNSK